MVNQDAKLLVIHRAIVLLYGLGVVVLFVAHAVARLG